MPKKPKKTSTIDIYADGSIKVRDVLKNKDAEKITKAKFIEMIKKHKIRGIESATIVSSNPCRWIKIGNQWYYMCW